jgi:putative transposase
VGGLVYHVLNRANGRRTIFDSPTDFEAFERVLGEAQVVHPVPLLSYCIMPNHWHLVLAPKADGDLSRFVGWLTLTHTQRWHAHGHTAGSGHLYQGRFKSFPVQDDEHFLTVCRYVERNPVRAGLVEGAEHWRWGSLWRRSQATCEPPLLLGDWPMPRPAEWHAAGRVSGTELTPITVGAIRFLTPGT